MTTPIRRALDAKSPLRAHVKDGLRALKKEHVAFVDDKLRRSFSDSLDIDETLREGRERENRWDYLLGHDATAQIFGLEPHTANNHEVTTVIKKRERALEQLRGHLKPDTRVTAWFWVAAGKVDFLPMSKAMRRLASNGIQFVDKMLLQNHLPAAPPQAGSRPEAKKNRRRR